MIDQEMVKHYTYPLCIFMNRLGEVVVKDLDEAKAFSDPEWRHIASIEPKTYIQNVLNKNAKLVADFLRLAKPEQTARNDRTYPKYANKSILQADEKYRPM